MRDLIATLRSGHRRINRELDVGCPSIRAIAFRDVLDLWLRFASTQHRQWIDIRGRVLERQPFLRAGLNIIRDLVAWPLIYYSQRHRISRLASKTTMSRQLDQYDFMLYLRTDHWFGLKSGGSVGHTAGVIKGFRQEGLRVHVVSTDHLAYVARDEDFCICEPVYGLGRNIPNMPEVLFNKQVFDFIEQHWHKWSPSIIYQRYSFGNYAGVMLSLRHNVPYICEYNGSFPWMARHWGSGKLLHEGLINRIELLNLIAADLIVVVSDPSRQELLDRGISDSKILVNPNGVNSDRYAPWVEGSEVRHRYGFPDKTVIGFIGSFAPWHGAEVLADAFGNLIQEDPELRKKVRLLMIGDGEAMARVKGNLEKYNVMDLCILTGLVPQQEGPGHLAACDILALPHVPNPDGTPFFGSPTKLFEYMAMGKGIVASDLDQIGEILEHKKTAWMVKPEDVKSLVQGLKTLIDDENLRNKLGRAAREKVVSKYTWKEHTKKIIEKLKEQCQ